MHYDKSVCKNNNNKCTVLQSYVKCKYEICKPLHTDDCAIQNTGAVPMPQTSLATFEKNFFNHTCDTKKTGALY